MKDITNYTVKELQEIYLDWVNNFISVAYFAEYHRYTVEFAEEVIAMGRTIHHQLTEIKT